MRNKVRKSLAFLLALALVVSVMSGLGLSVSAEQESNTPGTEEVQQQDKTEAGAAPSEVNAEEEAAKPKEKPVQEEKEDEQKKQEETKTDDAAKDDANAQDGNQKDEPQAEPAAEEPAEPVGEVANKQTLPVANAPRATMRNDIVVPEPSYKKKAEYNAQNDAYDLSLSVSGNVSSQTERSKGTEVFTDVKYGTEFTVSENDYSNDGYTTSYKVNNGDKNNGSACTTTVTSDTTITFVNDKTIQPPNGIITTIAPYAIMVVLAAGAGVYFVYSRRRRNR